MPPGNGQYTIDVRAYICPFSHWRQHEMEKSMTRTTTVLTTLRALAVCLTIVLTGCATRPEISYLSCETPLHHKLEKTCVVTENELWRGARPDRAAIAGLVERGIKTFVNLEFIHEDLREFEAALVNPGIVRELNYFRVRDWEPLVLIAPSILDGHVAHFLAVMRTQSKPIFVHCSAGQNRTGVMVAAYRVFSGSKNIEEAIVEMEKYRGVWFEHDAAYIRSLTPERRATFEKPIADWAATLKPSAYIKCADGRCAVRSR